MMNEEVMLADIAVLDPQLMQSRQCPLKHKKIFWRCVTAVSDALLDKTNDSAFLAQVAEKSGSDVMVLDPLICSGFSIEVR